MARYLFGGSSEDLVFMTVPNGQYAYLALPPVGTQVAFYTAQTGGSQITDLLNLNNQPIRSVTVGANGLFASQIYGPDDAGAFASNALFMWADAGTGQRFLIRAMSVTATGAIQVTEAQVTGLTADLANKAPLASPAFTGSPTAVTQAALDNSTKLATTGYADAAVAVERTRAQTFEATLPSNYVATTNTSVDAPALGLYFPEAHGAVGDGVHDDTTALQAAMDAAASNNGGQVVLSKRYGWSGDFFHRSKVHVQGYAAVDYVSPASFPQKGTMVALSSTSRYRYGQFGQTGALGDTPGSLKGVVIDGASIGGSGAELFRAECVEGSVKDVWVIQSAGDAVTLASTQNSIFDHVHTAYTAGSAWVLKENVTGVSQGPGANKIRNCYSMYFQTAVKQTVSSGAGFWAHDNVFDGCLFEAYQSISTFLDIDNGEVLFRTCTFTFSTSSATASLNTMCRVRQVAFPTTATVVSFDHCNFSGGVTTPPQDAITSYGTNYIHFAGYIGVTGCANLVGLESGSSRIVQGGAWLNLPSGSNFDRIGTGGGRAGEYNVQYTGMQFQIPSSAVAAIDHRFPGDTGTRVSIGSGVIGFGDGAGGSAGNIAAYFGTLGLNGIVTLQQGLTRLVTSSTGATGTVSINTGTGSFYAVECASNASITINLSGNPPGREIRIAILGNGTNTLSWAQTIQWGLGGPPAAPTSGNWLVVHLVYAGSTGTWMEAGAGRGPRTPRVRVPIYDPLFAMFGTLTKSSGVLKLNYFTADRNMTVNNITTVSGSTAATSATAGYVGLYSVDSSGNLTLMSASANTTTLWSAANTIYTTALSAAQTITSGSRYAVASLIVTAGTAPTMSGQIPAIAISADSPRFSGQITGQSTLPSTITAASVAANSTYEYCELS